MPWPVLAGWALVGVVLMFAGRYRKAEVAYDEAAIGGRRSGAPGHAGG
jgi:cytochrome c-type biogenesis protein CcmH/NrfG